jgi:hypothetical protein
MGNRMLILARYAIVIRNILNINNISFLAHKNIPIPENFP